MIKNHISQFLGVMIIMDMVVLMADGSIANIEIQKISYDFPAERISCYSADLVLRQYNDELVSEKLKRDRLKFLSLFVAETPQEIDRLIEIFPDLESVR